MPLNGDLQHLSGMARRAAQMRDWTRVRDCARKILRLDSNSAEGFFLSGLAESAARQQSHAARSFRLALESDGNRYDAAVELASQYLTVGKNSEARSLLDQHTGKLQNSPHYLELAATTYTRLGLHEKAWPLYARALELQPEIERFQSGLAACNVLLGKFDDARANYESLLQRNPGNHQFHYELSKLDTAKDSEHVHAMQAVLESDNKAASENVFLYYALGKELEDLGQWEDSFRYYQMGGDAALSSFPYDVSSDIQLFDTVVEACDSQWLQRGQAAQPSAHADGAAPIFIVGLPRTGTTIVERILSSHSQVESADESHYLEMALKQVSRIASKEQTSPAIIKAAAGKKPDQIAGAYLRLVEHRLSGSPYFVEKYPGNFLLLGFVAVSFPQAKIVQVTRHPMDACFAMFKQSYFRHAYSLDDLGKYYVAYRRLRNHWEAELGDRLINIGYESLVADQESETRRLLAELDLPFEEACLNFHQLLAPSATASNVQVREKVHSRSVNRWRKFEHQLRPLQDTLREAGVEID